MSAPSVLGRHSSCLSFGTFFLLPQISSFLFSKGCLNCGSLLFLSYHLFLQSFKKPAESYSLSVSTKLTLLSVSTKVCVWLHFQVLALENYLYLDSIQAVDCL